MPFIDPSLITVSEGRGREDFSDVDEMAQSIKEIGQIHPILVQELPSTPENFTNLLLLAGETRLRACMKLNREVWYQTTKTGRLDASTELQRTRIEAMENLRRKDLNPYEKGKLVDKIDRLMKEEYGQSIGGRYQSEEDSEKWNTEKTAKMLGYKSKSAVSDASRIVRAAEIIPEIKTAKTTSEQKALFMAAIKAEAREELIKRARNRIHSAATTETTISSNGLSTTTTKKEINLEQWVSGKVFCGNSEELLKKIPPGTVDIWLTDTPYGVNFQRDDPKINTDSKKSSNTLYDDDPKEIYDLLRRCIPLMTKASKTSCYVFWFCSFKNWSRFATIFEENGFNVMNKPIIWIRGDIETKKFPPGACPSPDKWPASSTDCCLFAHRNGRLVKQGRPDYIISPPVTSNEKEHSVEKPVEVMYWLLEFITIDILPQFICDPFMGSGTSLVAAIRMNPENNILGFDQNPECIEIAKGRIIAERIIKNESK